MRGLALHLLKLVKRVLVAVSSLEAIIWKTSRTATALGDFVDDNQE